MMIRTLLVLLAIPFLIGCSEKATNPVLSPSALVKASITPTLISTQTPLPTPSSTMTARPTPIPFPTTPAEATEQAIADRYCDSRDFPSPNGFLPSKSGKLMAFVCWPSDGTDISVTRVVALDGSLPPVQASYRKDYMELDDSESISEYLQEPAPPWLGHYALWPVRWTADDKFLYLARGSPASGVQYPPQVFALIRLNVETGKVTPVLPPGGNYYYDFSADGTKLLSVEEVKTPVIVKVADLVSGIETKFYLDKRFDQAGFFRPSPDESKLLISALDYEKGYSVVIADLRSKSLTYLDEEIRYDFHSMSWVDDHTIYGSFIDIEKLNTFFFYFDTIIKQTRPAPTPTLIPTPTP